ncbi:MAG TPA: hypothetical protein VJZ00_09715, partial [Thermoanaerobaculia bacterium]|nr:hypothetical protein [Thermoanaerobaculia bacterium]
MDSENGALRTPVLILFLLAAVWIAALLQRGLPLAPDELEFFRATRWTSLGQLPFRDFWEHHTPLQWLMFAPVARLASGAGANAVVLMRWAHVSLWIATLWMLVAIARRAGARACGWAFALLLLLLSPTFLARALEYRVDVPGHFFFVAAIYCTFSRRWIAFGALMSAAVLANMRLAPLVMFAGALALFWPRWNPRALRMAIGIVAVVAAFFAYLAATGSMPGFIEGVIGYNRLSSHVLAVRTFADALFAPFMTFDLAGIVFWLAGAAGAVLALREFHERGPLQFLAMIAIASVAAVAAMQVQYDYHFQTTWVLLLPLAARAIERLPQPRWRHLAVTAGIAGWLIGIARLAPDFGAAMRYQNDVMLAADRLTSPGETVFDGGGYALRRAPAWEYWFLTTGVRFLALRGAIPRYDAAQMAAHPPAAI